MKATINKTFQINEPIDRVWDFLSDPHQLVTCVPGASLTEQVDDRNYKGEVTLKFGPIKAKYAGAITFEELDIESRTMKMKGKGLDSKGKGSADMIMNGALKEIEGGTEVDYSMEVVIIGMLAQFGSRLITDVTNSIFDQFIGNFKAKLAGEKVDNTLSAGAVVGSVVKGVFKKKQA